MKRLIAYFVTGMRTGSFFYLGLVLLAHIFPSIIYPAFNVRNILAIFLMSGTMGILSVMIEELEFLAYSLRVVLHLLVTAVILVLTHLLPLAYLLVDLWPYLALSDLANPQANPED